MPKAKTSRNRHSPNAPATVPELLRAAADTYEQRNKLYGDNYKQIGAGLAALFPQGIPAMDADGWNRFAAWMMLYYKTVRYAIQLPNGGHKDSAHDAAVYAAMLEELTP